MWSVKGIVCIDQKSKNYSSFHHVDRFYLPNISPQQMPCLLNIT